MAGYRQTFTFVIPPPATSENWRKFLNVEGDYLQSSTYSLIRVIRSRRVRWADHVACIGGKINVCNSVSKNPEWKNWWERGEAFEKILLKWI